MTPTPYKFKYHPNVLTAQQHNQPVVALESAVITHGLPFPENLNLARDMEAQITTHGAVPATIALLQGQIMVGLHDEQLTELAQSANPRKISVRDFAPAIVQGADGGTTVAGTLIVAARANIKVFATGGIGGVHRDAPFDVSTDLQQLAHSPVVVVCAGAKSILDLPATLEVLETMGVPVVGYQTDEFPAFFSRRSGLPTPFQAQDAKEAAAIARQHWGLGLHSAVLVVVPPPEDVAIPFEEIESSIQQAQAEAQAAGIRGQAVTPFLLSRVKELSGGRSLQANLGLLKNNAQIAAKIAQHLYPTKQQVV